jgi:hypothetical protein
MIYVQLYVTFLSIFFGLYGLPYCSYFPFHRELLQEVLETGHSRVPVYYEQKINIIGLTLVMLFSVVISYAF